MRPSVLITIAAIALTASSGCSSTPQDMTVKGTVVVEDNPAAGIDPPVQVGSQVTVTDPAGKVIGFGSLPIVQFAVIASRTRPGRRF